METRLSFSVKWTAILIVGSAVTSALGGQGATTPSPERRQIAEGPPATNYRTLNYAALARGGQASAWSAGKQSPAAKVVDGDWLSAWQTPQDTPSGARYPVVIHRDLGKMVRVNRLRVALGPEIVTCPIVYTHNVNSQGTGVGGSMKVSSLAAMLDWIAAQKYQPLFFSDFLRFVRTNRLPPGVSRPIVILFCTGQRGVYEHAFELLRQRKMKFVATCWELKGADPRFLAPPQIREMLASGLFEPGIYTKWTTHRFGPDTGPVTGNTTVAFPKYDPAGNEYESLVAYEDRLRRQADELVRSLRSDYGYRGEVVWEIPSTYYNLTMIRVARHLGIPMLVNTGKNLNLYGSPTLPNLGMVSMSETVGSLESRQKGILAVTGTPVVRQYRYEVYISAAKQPDVKPGWETNGDWHKVVFERAGAGVEIDPLYPRSAAKNVETVTDDLNGAYVKFRHLRLKLLGERENRPAVVNELDLCFETASESELQEMRLRNIEGEAE